MCALITIIFFTTILAHAINSVTPPPYYPQPIPLNPDADYGEVLYLTPLIESGRVEEAKNASRVGNMPNVPVQLESYSGYITVNKTYNSNLFFWYFPALESPEKAETFIWLQGGPGWSSMYGLFMESGPYVISDKFNVSMQEYTWTRLFNVIYVDNPVGTGFSYTNSSEGYAKNSEDIENELYSFVLQLFKLFPEFQKTDFYVGGESYAGKYVVHLSNKLDHEKPENINFVGFFLGNPVLSFKFITLGDQLYNLGLVNVKQRRHFDHEIARYRFLLKEGQRDEAIIVAENLFYGFEKPTYFNNVTGFTTTTDYLYSTDLGNVVTYEEYLALPELRKAIHVSDLSYNPGSRVFTSLGDSISEGVNDILGRLLNDYKVMLYYGQNDLLMTYRDSVDIINHGLTKWNNQSQYNRVERDIWRVDPDDVEVAGYVTPVDQFRHVLIRNAGHMAPNTKPRSAFDAVRRFIKNVSFSD